MAGVEFSGAVIGRCGNRAFVATGTAAHRMDARHPCECAAGIDDGDRNAADYFGGLADGDMVGNPARRGVGKGQPVEM